MSKIEWTEETWNPIIGCSKISPGCQNCYAEKMAGRLAFIDSTKYYGKVVKMTNYAGGNEFEDPDQWVAEGWNGKTHFVNSALDKPLKRKKPTMYFVCSMGDLFHESVQDYMINEVMDVIANCPQHTFQILTKRPERMRDYFNDYYLGQPVSDTLENVWIGVTAENQEQANNRIPYLADIQAKVRFVSIEPMLSAVDLFNVDGVIAQKMSELNPYTIGFPCDLIDWVICGGESGPEARPMHPDWVRSLRDQCKEVNVPFFFKQYGEWMQVGECGNCEDSKYYNHPKCQILNLKGNQGYHGESALYMMKVGKKKAGCLLNGVEYKEYPKT